MPKPKPAEERAVEKLYREYNFMLLRLVILQPRMTAILSDMPKIKMNDSKIEKLAIERTELSRRKEFVQRCYACMTKDEKYFIRRRYYDNDCPMKVLAQEMGYDIHDLYRLRESVIAKTVRRAKKEGFKL